MGEDLFARLSVIEADITTLDVDAIVNAANPQLMAGGGVCGAIHRAAGPELSVECGTLGGCATGDAKITRGYNLPAKYVVHAVGPIWHGGGSREDDHLASSYRRSLEIAADNGVETIAFPAISTGIYGFPPERAAKIAVATVADFLAGHELPKQVTFCCFGPDSADLHARALEALKNP